jgi:protoporphyrinogen oxidase
MAIAAAARGGRNQRLTPSSERGSAPVVILGAGPAGLAAAYALTESGVPCTLIEKESAVGGLARTFQYKDHLFDLGGHRFYTKVALVERLWNDLLKDDFLDRPRLSRIYFREKFFQYPLEPFDVVRGLGCWEVMRCGASYLRSHLFPTRPEPDFETWVSNRFGRRLFENFFEAYTEKVWGIPCNRIHADWAAQRIRGLSLLSLVRNAVRFHRGAQIRTLIRAFQYPRRGPGMMWERMQSLVAGRGATVELNAPVEKILWRDGAVESVIAGGREYPARHLISTIPIRELIEKLDPEPPDWLREAAADFHYRDFLTVALLLKGPNPFPDNWIYVHDPAVAVGRIQNYRNWSPEMAPEGRTALGLEYFCAKGDSLWETPDRDLIARARAELAQLGLNKGCEVVDGTVLRMEKAYPVYDDSHERGLDAIRRFLDRTPNLQLAGRNGMHRYNNMDHSMLAGILAARNILGGKFDLWSLNTDSDYQEAGPPSARRG